MNKLLTIKNYKIEDLNLFLIALIPIALLAGSLLSNSIIILIGILFLLDLLVRKNNYLLKDNNFYFLIIIYLYIVLNSFFISENPESPLKAIGLLRFIILAYAISFYFKKFEKKIIKIWSVIFIIVSIDILIEYFFGKNSLGFSSQYETRIASFTGDELKIGGFYFGFIFICLSFFQKKKIQFYSLMIIFFLIALMIGERSNFIKIFIMYLFFIVFFWKYSWPKKILLMITVVLVTSFIVVNNMSLFNKYFNQIFEKTKNIETNNDSNIFSLPIKFKELRHFAHYDFAIEMFKKNKLVGSGFKDFRIESYSSSDPDKIYSHGSTHPHQTHFEILAELGLIGYFLIILNIILIIIKNIRDKESTFITKSGILFLIATFMPILPSGSFFTSYVATIFWINYSFLIRKQ
tara:strand:- start:6239 stop:7456 length:1218 start_codon:yes stop_codon:yes gene_type:complete